MNATIANMRSLGRRDILVHCGNAPRCWHHSKINADRWPDDAAFIELAPRFVCTGYGTRGGRALPAWPNGPDVGRLHSGGLPITFPKILAERAQPHLETLSRALKHSPGRRIMLHVFPAHPIPRVSAPPRREGNPLLLRVPQTSL